MIKITENFIEKIKSPKALVIIGLVGIMLIFLSSFAGGEKEPEIENTGEISVEAYRLGLEEDVCRIVNSITGSKNATVVVTLESGLKYSYADTKEQSSAEKSEKEATSQDTQLKEGYITVKSPDGGEEALLVTASMPEIRGVAVVCDGGDDEIIREKIESTVTAALNITSKRVYICGRKQ